MNKADRMDAVGKIRSLPGKAVVVPRQGFCDLSDFFGMAEFAVRRYGASLLTFDHLDFALKDVNSLQEIDAAVLSWNQGVSKLNVHGHLGVHPKKKQEGRDGKAKRLSSDDLRGSAKINQLSHNGLMIRKPGKNGVSIISVEKIRWEGVSNKRMPMPVPTKFNPKSLRYENAPTQDFDSMVQGG